MVHLDTSLIIGALWLSGSSVAHMIMNTPTPYNSRLLATSPLGPGFPFPCHGNFDITEVTNVTAGTTQTVKFTGSAVHGGGSCQFSVNYGDQPSDNPAEWKVIYTIIGGCPADAAGNIEGTAPPDADQRPDGRHCGNSVDKECVRQFDIPIPKGLPNGKFNFSWTWFNKIGNREMYMNCAPMVLSGGSDSTGFVDSLPSLFVANVDGFAQCTTGQGILNIPDPGKAGVVLAAPSASSEGTCKKADAPNFDKALSGALGGDGSSSDSGSGSGSSSGPSQSPPGGIFATVPHTTLQTFTTSTMLSNLVVPVTTSTMLSNLVVPVTTSTILSNVVVPVPTGGGSSTGAGGTTSCSEEGALVCLDAGYFGICDHGKAVRMELAAGTTCQDGKIVRRSA